MIPPLENLKFWAGAGAVAFILSASFHLDGPSDFEAAQATEASLNDALAQAKAGNYDRLRDAFDYRENDAVIFRALVLCANKGNVEARDALDTLARTWAELHAEVDE